MNKIKTGLAAYGMSGQVFHAPFISTNPHFELTAITERAKTWPANGIRKPASSAASTNCWKWTAWNWS